MSWLYGFLCLVFLILFHEFGHFVAAKIIGVKVESFSIGFGPVIFHKTINGTDFRISLLPLGGYCGMKGENDFQKAVEDNLTEIIADKDSFYGVKSWKRGIIAFSGPFFNFLFAIIGYTLINLIGYSYQVPTNKIIIPSEQESTISIAKDAGLQTGDKIIKINKTKINDWNDILQNITINPNEDLIITVDRNGEILNFNLHTYMDKSNGSGKIGIKADIENLITKQTPNYNLFQAIGKGFLDTIDVIKITFKSIKILFKGVEIKNTMSGLLRTTDLLGSTVQAGFSQNAKNGFLSMFELMAIISVSLCIMNLLPIPVLDGGLILIAVIETIIRKKIKPKIQYYIQFIGIAFIILCFVLALYCDISYFTNRSN